MTLPAVCKLAPLIDSKLSKYYLPFVIMNNNHTNLLTPMDDSYSFTSILSILIDRGNDFERYFELSMQQTLTKEEDIKFIAEILEEAISSKTLGYVLEKIDDLTSSELAGESESLERYELKQPWLSEYLVCTCNDQEFYLLLQKYLSNRQLYDGQLNGIHGEKTRKALEEFKQMEKK